MRKTTIEVPSALVGERIDRALALVTGRSRAEVAALIESGAVRIGGRTVRSRATRLLAAVEVEFEWEEVEPLAKAAVVAAEVPFGVVYEDEELVVVDKPAGLVVHPGAGREGASLAAGLLARFPDIADAVSRGELDATRPGIVHRLDKDTSGLLVVARNGRAHAALSAQLARRAMGRDYLALAIGAFDADSGTIEAPVGRSTRNRTKMAVTLGGRAALTRYRVVTRYRTPFSATLAELELETGRTHQIRVHLAAIGHPVAGDTSYRGALSTEAKAASGLRRPFLHAARLRLVHPVTGEELVWTSALPPDLSEALAKFA